jgi:bloom syndrome protein
VFYSLLFPDQYLALNTLREEYPDVPLMALTATANEMTVKDIIRQLRMTNELVLIQSFNRSNLHYVVRPKSKGIIAEIAAFINTKYSDKCGIIYCLSRDNCETVAKKLTDEYGLKARHYHAGMRMEDRANTLKGWLGRKCNIIVATVRCRSILRHKLNTQSQIAFGMGIDKADGKSPCTVRMKRS